LFKPIYLDHLSMTFTRHDARACLCIAACLAVGCHSLALSIDEFRYILEECPAGFACPGHFDDPRDANKTRATSDVDLEYWVDEAFKLYDEGNFRGAATIFQDLLEYSPGNGAINGHLQTVYAKLYPKGGDFRPFPVVPLDERFDEAMARTTTVGTLVEPGGVRYFGKALEGSKGKVYVVDNFLSPEEIIIMRDHTAAIAAVARDTNPVICFLHDDYNSQPVFQNHNMRRDAPMCLDPTTPSSKRLARRLRNSTSTSLAMWPYASPTFFEI